MKSRKKKPSSAKKRPAAAAKAGDDDDDGAPKRKKVAKEAVDPASVDWVELRNRDGGLESLTVPDLKVYLKNNSLPLGGTKPVLIERIKDHIDTQA